MKTKWELHVEKFGNGCGDDHCNQATKVVLARGQIPADILFIGEAPGVSEDVSGKPFHGPAGKLLDQIIADSIHCYRICDICRRGNHLSASPFPPGNQSRLLPCGHDEGAGSSIRIGFTNIVGCIPRDERGNKVHNPEKAQIKSCLPRLVDFVKVANPKLIVRVGKLAETWTSPDRKEAAKFHKKIPMVEITHPAAILRANVANQGLMIQRCIVVLTSAVEDYF